MFEKIFGGDKKEKGLFDEKVLERAGELANLIHLPPTYPVSNEDELVIDKNNRTEFADLLGTLDEESRLKLFLELLKSDSSKLQIAIANIFTIYLKNEEDRAKLLVAINETGNKDAISYANITLGYASSPEGGSQESN
ncbi:hypothetical protein COB18_02990 [Candidatus Kaiserbacteria bacterium]|nr:MAG: hypothetical protein COB18_02990 [Candidatus Kaiserbacteria bacterium]